MPKSACYVRHKQCIRDGQTSFAHSGTSWNPAASVRFSLDYFFFVFPKFECPSPPHYFLSGLWSLCGIWVKFNNPFVACTKALSVGVGSRSYEESNYDGYMPGSSFVLVGRCL